MKHKIGIIGLGYVGFPLMFEMLKEQEVVGFDLDKRRVESLRDCRDLTGEIHSEELSQVISKGNLNISDDESILEGVDVYIVTVPTPVDIYNVPDLNPLKSSMRVIARYLKEMT